MTPVTGRLCVYITEGGIHDIMVIADAMCGSDTCQFSIQVDMSMPPEVTCPDEIDTILCLVEPTDLCFPGDRDRYRRGYYH